MPSSNPAYEQPDPGFDKAGTKEEAEVLQAIRALKTDDLCIHFLGQDGVMRTLDADRNVLDAFGMTPKQIEAWLNYVPAALRVGADKMRNADGEFVDGTKISAEEMFRRNLDMFPAPMPKETQAEYRKRHAEREERERERVAEELEAQAAAPDVDS